MSGAGCEVVVNDIRYRVSSAGCEVVLLKVRKVRRKDHRVYRGNRVTCYGLLRVTCYVLRVTCYVLRVTCYVLRI